MLAEDSFLQMLEEEVEVVPEPLLELRDRLVWRHHAVYQEVAVVVLDGIPVVGASFGGMEKIFGCSAMWHDETLMATYFDCSQWAFERWSLLGVGIPWIFVDSLPGAPLRRRCSTCHLC